MTRNYVVNIDIKMLLFICINLLHRFEKNFFTDFTMAIKMCILKSYDIFIDLYEEFF